MQDFGQTTHVLQYNELSFRDVEEAFVMAQQQSALNSETSTYMFAAMCM